MHQLSIQTAFKTFREYGLGEFLEIIGELSQESAKKGALDRGAKELIALGLALSKRCYRCIDIHTREAMAVGATESDVNQVRKIVLFLNAAPWHDDLMFEQWEASWRQFSRVHGPLAQFERELVALAIAVQRHHEGQMNLHVREALALGATPAQVVEVMPLVLLMDGAPALSQIPAVLQAVAAYQEPSAISA